MEQVSSVCRVCDQLRQTLSSAGGAQRRPNDGVTVDISRTTSSIHKLAPDQPLQDSRLHPRKIRLQRGRLPVLSLREFWGSCLWPVGGPRDKSIACKEQFSLGGTAIRQRVVRSAQVLFVFLRSNKYLARVIMCHGDVPGATLPIILSELSGTSGRDEQTNSQFPQHHGLISLIRDSYSGHWIGGSSEFAGISHGPALDERMEPGTEGLLLQFDVRVLTVPLPFPPPILKAPSSTVKWWRVYGRIRSPLGGLTKYVPVQEKRYSILLRSTCEFDLPVFSLVTLADWDPVFTLGTSQPSLADRSEWESSKIQPSVRAAGVSAFAFRIRSLFTIWEVQWTNLLNGIDRVLRVKVCPYCSG